MNVLPALLLALAADLPPADLPIENVVDQQIDAKLKQSNVTPAPQADDAAFLRRVTLDLAGRIPTAAEVQAYLASAAPDRKAQVVDRLLASPAHVRHEATELDVMLSANRPGELRNYLLQAVADNRGWDKIFRELLLPTEDDPKKKGAGSFLRQRVGDLDRLSNDVSVLF